MSAQQPELVPCQGPKCRLFVNAEPGKPARCRLCQDAVIAVKATQKFAEIEAERREQQVQHRLNNPKWATNNRRFHQNNQRREARAAAARAMPPPPKPTIRFGNHPSGAPAGRGHKNSSQAVPRRDWKEESVGPGNKVSKTGRVQQAGFLDDDNSDDDLPLNPVGSMNAPPRPSKHQIDRHKENIRNYTDGDLSMIGSAYDDDDEEVLPENPLSSMCPPSRPSSDHFMHKEQMRGSNNALDRRTTGTHSQKVPNVPRAFERKDLSTSMAEGRSRKPHSKRSEDNANGRRPLFNRMGGIVDEDDEDEPTIYQEIVRRSLRDRNLEHVSRPAERVRSKMTLGSEQSSANRRPRKKMSAAHKILQFKDAAITALDQAEEAGTASKTWAVPRRLNNGLAHTENLTEPYATASALAAASASMSLGAPDDDSALADESQSDSGSDMSQQTLQLNEKMSMWHVDSVAEETTEAAAFRRELIRQTTKAAMPDISDYDLTKEIERQMKLKPPIRRPVPDPQPITQARRKLTRFELGMIKNKPIPTESGYDDPQGQALQQQEPPRKKRKLFEEKSAKSEAKVLQIIIPSYRADTDDSASSTSSENASIQSKSSTADVDALSFLQGLPKAMKQGTLKPTTPQKVSGLGALLQSENNSPAVGKDEPDSVSRKLFADNAHTKKHKGAEISHQEAGSTPPNISSSSFDDFLNAIQEAANDPDAVEENQEYTSEDGYPKHWTYKQRMDAYVDDDTGTLPIPTNSPLVLADHAAQGQQELGAAEEPSTFALDHSNDSGLEKLSDALAAMEDQEPSLTHDDSHIDGLVCEAASEKVALATISAKELRIVEGLPTDSPIDDKIMLDFASKAQHMALDKEQQDDAELQRQIEHDLMMEEAKMKKKQYENEKKKLMEMSERGDDVAKQRIFVRVLEKKFDELMASLGLKNDGEELSLE